MCDLSVPATVCLGRNQDEEMVKSDYVSSCSTAKEERTDISLSSYTCNHVYLNMFLSKCVYGGQVNVPVWVFMYVENMNPWCGGVYAGGEEEGGRGLSWIKYFVRSGQSTKVTGGGKVGKGLRTGMKLLSNSVYQNKSDVMPDAKLEARGKGQRWKRREVGVGWCGGGG